MKVTYVGGSTQIVIVAIPLTVGRGETVDVPDDIGVSLTESDEWESEKPSSSKKKKGED